jgi:NitT/TauT family transport system ATP-binding protein
VSQDATPAIALAGVAKTFRRGAHHVDALARIDLDVALGEFVAIVGPSGCGKSTLLRIVAGLIESSEGDVVTLGRAVRGPVAELGIVFQAPVLLDWRDTLGNVLAQLELRGIDPAPHRERALRLLDAVGLGDFTRAFPHELSGGMRQRVQIVRALIHDPPLLLMDEPFGALDALTREQMRVDLESLWLAERKTVQFVTHSIDEAVLLADRVVVMTERPGRIDRVFNIDLPRPRGLEARRLPGYEATVNAITEIFLARGVLRRGAFLAGAKTP